MIIHDANDFWLRYKKLAGKDYPVIIRTGIKQSTLSTWKNKNKYPRALEAFEIAKAINTTVEYLVSGEEILPDSSFSPDAYEIAIISEELTEEGVNVLKTVATCLKTSYAKEKSCQKF